MAWNYRVFRHANPDGSGHYMIHEAHYTNGVVTSWTEGGAKCSADTKTDLLSVLAMMADALGHPVMDSETGAEIEPAKELSDDFLRVIQTSMTDLFDLDTDAAGKLVVSKKRSPALSAEPDDQSGSEATDAAQVSLVGPGNPPSLEPN